MGKRIEELVVEIDGRQIPKTYNDLSLAKRKLKKDLKGLVVGTDEYVKKSQQLNQVNKRIDTIRKDIGKVGTTWKKQQSIFSQAKSTFIGAFSALTVAGTVQKIFQLGKASIKLNLKLAKVERTIKRMSKISGKELNAVSVQAIALADTYDENVNDVIEATNGFAKRMQISFTSAMNLIEKGFENGANDSGEFLDILKEYPTFFKEAGISADEAIKLITQQVRDGIYSDKGIDSIKEATIRLREMPKATKEALQGIGLSSNEITKALEENTITYFDAIQLVSNKLNDLEDQSPAVGRAIADIFGGAGEDAGLDYLRSLGKIDFKTQQLSGTNQSFEASLLKVRKAFITSFANPRVILVFKGS